MELKVYRKKGRPKAHVIEILTEQVSDAYLSYLRKFDISYLFVGNKTVTEFGEIMPGPTYEKVMEGAELEKEGVEALAAFIKEIDLLQGLHHCLIEKGNQ